MPRREYSIRHSIDISEAPSALRVAARHVAFRSPRGFDVLLTVANQHSGAMAMNFFVNLHELKIRNALLLAADDKPLTRAQICEEARRAPKFADRPQPTFSGDAETSGVGKVLDSSYTRESISWEPRFKTFADFVDMEMMTARR